MSEILPYVFILIISLGVLSSAIPFIPSMLFMYFTALLYSILDGFVHITPANIMVFSLIFLGSILLDFGSGLIGAKLGGASKRSIFMGFLGMIAGLLIAPPFGALLGLFAGVLVSELARGEDAESSLKSAGSTLIGAFIGTLLNVVLALFFLILFVVYIFV